MASGIVRFIQILLKTGKKLRTLLSDNPREVLFGFSILPPRLQEPLSARRSGSRLANPTAGQLAPNFRSFLADFCNHNCTSPRGPAGRTRTGQTATDQLVHHICVLPSISNHFSALAYITMFQQTPADIQHIRRRLSDSLVPRTLPMRGWLPLAL